MCRGGHLSLARRGRAVAREEPQGLQHFQCAVLPIVALVVDCAARLPGPPTRGRVWGHKRAAHPLMTPTRAAHPLMTPAVSGEGQRG